MTPRNRLAVAVLLLGFATGCDATPATSPSASLSTVPVARQMQCENIRRAYTDFRQDAPWLLILSPPTTIGDAVAAESRVEQMLGNADRLVLAAKGYEDQPSRDLVVAVSQFTFELTMLNLMLSVQGTFDQAKMGLVAAAALGVEDKYKTFDATC